MYVEKDYEGALNVLKRAVIESADEHGYVASAAAVGAVFCSTVGALLDCGPLEAVQSYLNHVEKGLHAVEVRARFTLSEQPSGESALAASLNSLVDTLCNIIDEYGDVVAEASVGALLCAVVSGMVRAGDDDRAVSLLHAVARTLAHDGIEAVFTRSRG